MNLGIRLARPPPPGLAPASCSAASSLSQPFRCASRPKTANCFFNSLPVCFSPLVSGALGEAPRQLPAHRRISTAYTSSESTHDPIGAACPRCGPLIAVEGQHRRGARPSHLHHCRFACQGEIVTVAGFGKFAARPRTARQGRNSRTGKPVAVRDTRLPSFRAAKVVRDPFYP